MGALGATNMTAVARKQPLSPVRQRPRSVPAASHPSVEFGESLRRQCAEVAGKFAHAGGITITCTAVRAQLPRAVATQLALIAQGLIAGVFDAFEDGRGGRIGVSFQVLAVAWELSVEHSRARPRAAGRQGGVGSWLVRTLVARLGGRLESPRLIGGARLVVTVPRP